MTGVRVMRTLRLFQDEAFLIGIGFLIVLIQVALSTYLPQLTRVFSEATCVDLRAIFRCSPPLRRFCADGYRTLILQVERGGNFCPYSRFPIGPGKDTCPPFNRKDLALREAFVPVLDGIAYPSKCSTDSSQLLPGTHCFCTGTQSDPPLKVRLTSRHFLSLCPGCNYSCCRSVLLISPTAARRQCVSFSFHFQL